MTLLQMWSRASSLGSHTASFFVEVFDMQEMVTPAIERKPVLWHFANTIALILAVLYSFKQQHTHPEPVLHTSCHTNYLHTP